MSFDFPSMTEWELSQLNGVIFTEINISRENNCKVFETYETPKEGDYIWCIRWIKSS